MVADSDQHSSLLRHFINYSRKKLWHMTMDF
jgi:hypothetical protein